MQQYFDSELEKASNSYLMSLTVALVGLPFPIVNLIATIIFFLAHRKATSHFVRWHCMQSLLTQIPTFFINSALFWWTVSILFLDASWSIGYFVYLAIVLLFNIIELIATIFTAIEVRKGTDVRWIVYAQLTDRLCRKG